MQGLCRQINVSKFEEIAAAKCPFPPWPDGPDPEYIRGKNDPSTVTYLHPSLEGICRETYGIMVLPGAGHAGGADRGRIFAWAGGLTPESNGKKETGGDGQASAASLLKVPRASTRSTRTRRTGSSISPSGSPATVSTRVIRSGTQPLRTRRPTEGTPPRRVMAACSPLKSATPRSAPRSARRCGRWGLRCLDPT